MRPAVLFRLAHSAARTSTTSRSLPVTASQVRTFSSTPNMSASVEPSSPRARSPVRIPGPVETSIQQKLIAALQPTLIRISNDSSKHSHHTAMRAIGGGGGETHFAVALVSSAFIDLPQIKRHRLVNNLLKDEFDNQGLHALSLRLKTPDEWERETGGI